MKLQVGSSEVRGIYKRAEWINLDLQDVSDDGVNVIGSGLDMPFKDNSFEEIHCIHVLEHLTRDKPPVMLAAMHRVLRPGGLLYVEVPDFQGTVANLTAAFESGNADAIHIWTTSLYGKSERYGMSHHWGFYEGLLRREFRYQGFTDVDRLVEKEDMISTHYNQEPILLVRGTK